VSSLRRTHLCLLVVLAATLAGCGGNGYTKSDFVARADGICTNTLRQTRALAPPSAASDAGLSAYLGKLVPLVESEAEQLRALKRPSDGARDQATLTSYLGALGQVVAAYRRLEAAAAHGDDQTVADVEAALNANPVASLAAGYGLKTCGAPGSTSA
jgi:hypothetical protein